MLSTMSTLGIISMKCSENLMKAPDGLSHLRLTMTMNLSVFTTKALKSFITLLISLPLTSTIISNSPWSLTSFHMIFTTTLLEKQGNWTLLINISEIKPLTFIIASFLITFWHPNSAGNVISNNSLKMPQVKKNLMPYILPLKADGILRSKFEELLWKEKDVEGFASLIDLLHTIKVPFCWPLPILDCAYNSSLDSPYNSVLELNMWSFHLYLPYFSHNNLDIVVYEGLIVNQMICNPHCFASLCFDQFEAYAFLPMLNEPWDITQCPISEEVSKKICTKY